MKYYLAMILVLWPFVAHGELKVESEKAFYNWTDKVAYFIGKVKGWHGNKYFEADRLTYWVEAERVLAEGNVLLQEGPDFIKADRIEYDLKQETGVFYEALLFLSEKQYYIKANKIQKLGKDRYVLEGASLTSCDPLSPDWEFRSRDLKLKVEGYAQAKWPAFLVKGVPILAFPWAIFPVKKERQTGFLIPTFGYSDRYGPVVTVPFFWAISENQDATFYLTKHGDQRGRGLKWGVEYRYALKSTSYGEARLFGIKDRVERKDRWAVFGRSFHLFPQGVKGFLGLNLVSDDRYPSDFEDDFKGFIKEEARYLRYLQSTLDLRRNWPWGEAYVGFDYFQDLTTPEDDFTLHRLPRLGLRTFETRLKEDLPVFEKFEFELTNFYRQRGQRGQRLDFLNTLSLRTTTLGLFELEPWLELRDTLYLTEGEPTRNRFLPRAGISTRTSLFKPIKVMGKERLHWVEPVLSFEWIPEVGQSRNPNYDSIDRIEPTRSLTLEITQRLTDKDLSQEVFYLKLKQVYDFHPGLEEKERLKPLIGEMHLVPLKGLSLWTELAFNHSEGRFDSFRTRGSFAYRALRLSGEYYSDLKADTQGLGFYGSISTPKVDLWTSYRYNLKSKYRVETAYGLVYRRGCWELSFLLEDIGASPDRKQRAELKVTVGVLLRGIGTYELKGALER